MIVNIFQSLKDASTTEEASNILRSIGRYELFARVFMEYPDTICVLKFILFAYSIESNYLEVGDNWEEQRRRIAHLAGVPKNEQFEEIVGLHKRAMWKTVDEY